jgi:hypothetical protein
MSEFIETFGAKKKRDRKGYLKRKLEAARQDSAVGADEIREAEELFLRHQKRQRITNDEEEEMEEKEDAIADAQPNLPIEEEGTATSTTSTVARSTTSTSAAGTISTAATSTTSTAATSTTSVAAGLPASTVVAALDSSPFPYEHRVIQEHRVINDIEL